MAVDAVAVKERQSFANPVVSRSVNSAVNASASTSTQMRALACGALVGSGAQIAIRSDAAWNVPEPELVLLADAAGALIGCTIGNDVSSRDIEGENPLYLPQAKVYDASCAIGPALLVGAEPLPASTEISLQISRGGAPVFTGSTTLAELKRTPEELLRYLYRDNSFPHGCYLMTGTGIVPPDGFTLASGDTVAITIPAIGTLTNQVR